MNEKDNGLTLTAEQIRAWLDYDPITGLFTWKHRQEGVGKRVADWNRRWAGKSTGHVDRKGYVFIVLGKRQFKAHRIAWLHVHGEWPAGDIDHIDGNRANNAIANLRLATSRQNQMNKAVKVGKSGFRGVRKQDSRWRADIRIAGKKVFLGMFDTEVAAAAAYAAAAAAHHGEFAYSRTENGK